MMQVLFWKYSIYDGREKFVLWAQNEKEEGMLS
jgi:hypothetical protein